jgi:hypothetical protein
MNKKQLIWASLAIILLVIIYLISSSGRGVQKSVNADLLRVDSLSVLQVRFVKGDEVTLFERTDKGWELSGYPVYESGFNRLFTTLSRLKTDRFVSSKRSKYGKYGVDSTAMMVHFIGEKGEILKGFYIGKSGTAGETFIRPIDSPRVYSVLQYLGNYKDLKPESYYKKEIVEFKPSDLLLIEAQGDFNYKLENGASGWTYNDKAADGEKIQNLVGKLAKQKATMVSPDSIPEEALLLETIRLTPKNAPVVTLKYYKNDNKSTTVYVSASGNPMRFELPKGTWVQFNKKYEDLKPEEKKEENK